MAILYNTTNVRPTDLTCFGRVVAYTQEYDDDGDGVDVDNNGL